MKLTIDLPKGTSQETAQAIADTVTAATQKLSLRQWHILRRAMNASSLFLSAAFGKIESALNDHNIK